MIRIVLDVVGLLLIILGGLITPLPIPFGFIIVIFGIAILMLSEHWIRERVKMIRMQNPPLNLLFRVVGKNAPHFLREVIQETDPKYIHVPKDKN